MFIMKLSSAKPTTSFQNLGPLGLSVILSKFSRAGKQLE